MFTFSLELEAASFNFEKKLILLKENKEDKIKTLDMSFYKNECILCLILRNNYDYIHIILLVFVFLTIKKNDRNTSNKFINFVVLYFLRSI